MIPLYNNGDLPPETKKVCPVAWFMPADEKTQRRRGLPILCYNHVMMRGSLYQGLELALAEGDAYEQG